eukprot:1837079-Pleurochrysis_carterae.AAC.1
MWTILRRCLAAIYSQNTAFLRNRHNKSHFTSRAAAAQPGSEVESSPLEIMKTATHSTWYCTPKGTFTSRASRQLLRQSTFAAALERGLHQRGPRAASHSVSRA